MKTKVLFILAIFLMITINCIAQGLENRSGLGIIGPESFYNRNDSEPDRTPKYGANRLFNSAYAPSSAIGSSGMNKPPVADNMAPVDDITKEQLGLIFKRTKEFPEETEISIAFINNGRAVFYGLKRQNNSIKNIDNHSSVFEIGSITKVFTATLLANCIIDGTLDLEDPINNYLPFKMHNNIQITFKELANHTSGLPRNPSNLLVSAILNTENPYKNYSEDKLEEYLTGNVKVSDVSPKSFSYSNLGFGLLGYLLSKIENKGYNDLLNEKIFSKYGMRNSSAVRADLESKLVLSFSKNGSKTPNWDFASMESAGAVLSTTEDLSKFVIAQFDEFNRELALTRETSFYINENRSMGLGWFISKTESGDILYRHKGVTGGYKSAMAVNINNKKGIVILSNVSGFSKKTENIETLCFDLLATITKDK